MNRYVCIHGHFYQPPRENPWLEYVEAQDSAYPHHDWNARITSECYAPNAVSRILDPERRIIDLVNNYSKISFNFGPTLLSWLETHAVETYEAILEADRLSRKNFGGHGSALAQVYNHIIMPLANEQDKRTQIVWGIRDFERRFQRSPEGMWLAETAVDTPTLELLAAADIKFTILAPGQAQRVRKIGEEQWHDVSGGKIDPRRPYVCRLPSGKSIALFFYDGIKSHNIAFGKMLQNGEQLANELVGSFTASSREAQLAHIATDGETYGHHQKHGDMGLAYCLYYLETKQLAKITVYGEFLEKYPPQDEVAIHESSSWSCVHGVERWRGNCGCNSGKPGWTQDWRAPLRGAVDWLRDNLAHIYEEQMAGLVHDPWQARNAYIDVVLDRSPQSQEKFLTQQSGRAFSPDDQVRVMRLLEMQRHALLMYTSCGWFFDEISGLETVQVMQYAARAMQLARSAGGINLEEAFIGLVEKAASNMPEFKNGGVVYERFVKPAVLDLLRVGVHFAVSSLFTDYADHTTLYAYRADRREYQRWEVGKQKLGVGRVVLMAHDTGELEEVSFAVLHLGDHTVVGGARGYKGEEFFASMQQAMRENFYKGDIPEVIRLIDVHFSGHSYSLWHLFRDEQRKVLAHIYEAANKEIESSFRHFYETHSVFVHAAQNFNVPLPRHFSGIATFVVNTELKMLLESAPVRFDRLQNLIEESKAWHAEIDIAAVSWALSRRIHEDLERVLAAQDDAAILEEIVALVNALRGLPLSLNLWRAQNAYFSLGRTAVPGQREQAAQGREQAQRWLNAFAALGDCLNVKVL